MTSRYFNLSLSEVETHEPQVSVPVAQDVPGFNIWDLSAGKRFDADQPLGIEVDGSGQLLDLYLTAFNVPVASPAFAQVIREVADSEVQLVPCVSPSGTVMYILNLLASVDCIDRSESSILYQERDDKYTGKKAGDIQVVMQLVIDKKRTGDHRIFRLAGYRSAIILRSDLLELLRPFSISGLDFVEV